MTNIFAIQSDIAARVADALKIELFGAPSKPDPTANIEAYQLYLRGRQLWNRRTTASIREAIRCFERAIASDPNYALAHAGLADCYAILEDYDGTPARKTYPKARAAALRALELDPKLGQAYATLGSVTAYWDWQWAKGEAELLRALELDPNYATALHWYANLLSGWGRHEEALAAIRRAREIDPLSPMINVIEATKRFHVGDRENAIRDLQQLAAKDPDFLQARFILGSLYVESARYPDAIQTYAVAQEPYDLGFLGFACARGGQPERARTIIQQLRALQQTGRAVNLPIALIQNGLGLEREALDSLEKALNDKSTALLTLHGDSHWANLRPHPRFQAILRAMNLLK